MARQPSIDPLRATIQSLGEQIGAQLANAITSSFSKNISVPALTNAVPKRGRPGRKPAAEGKACAVPGCVRQAVSKGLCSNHYQKAHRIKLDTSKLSASDLDTLAQDARATRWKK